MSIVLDRDYVVLIMYNQSNIFLNKVVFIFLEKMNLFKIG
jgi:hypothetical protein